MSVFVPLLSAAVLALATLQPSPAAAPEPVAVAPEGPAEPLEIERPAPTPRTAPAAELERDAWDAEDRRLKLHAGLSGGFAGAMVLTGVLLFVLPGRCSDPHPDFGCGEIVLPYIIGAAMFPLALIPTGTGIYWGVRLSRHKKARPTANLRPGAGGFVLHF